MMPPAHLGIVRLEGVVAVVMMRSGGGGVVSMVAPVTRGRTPHGSAVVLPLALAQQFLLKQTNIVLILVQMLSQSIKLI